MRSIRDALEKALEDAVAKKDANEDGADTRLLLRIKTGVTAPAITYKSRSPNKSISRPDRSPPKKPAKKQRRPSTKTISFNGAAIDRRMRLALLKSRSKKRVPLHAPLAVYHGSAGRSSGRSGEMGAPPSAPGIVRIDASARVTFPLRRSQVTLLDRAIEERGIALEHIVGTAAAPRELVLGLDFGSSSTKLVISDRAAGKSFAVAVADDLGTRRFLLPTAIHETDGGYSLGGDGTLYTGLKSDLLTSPDNAGVRERAVAYMALAIRRARGWLFTTHESIYRDVPIFWTFTVGIPKQQGQIDRDTRLYTRLARAAWQAAGTPGAVTIGSALNALRRTAGPPGSDDTVEVRVVPEIAAEIYGFVSSESFDPNACNVFLMADVGGKTLDASLFHVRRNKANRWDFSFFTSVVRPLGAIELHGARIAWWQELLRARTCDEQAVRLAGDLEALRQASMFEETVPAKATGYMEGVELTQGAETFAPDASFRAEVRAAVRRRAYDNAFGVQLSDRQMDQVEYFVCGGGSRMAIYSKVIHAALTGPSGSLFHATRRILRVPGNLEAPGLSESEYDRFAVAYGLSRLDRTSVVDAEPLRPPKRRSGMYRDQFVSKDMC